MNKNNRLLGIALAGVISCSVPVSANTMLGAFIKHDGWSLVELDKFNADTAKSMAVTTLFTNFDMHWDSLHIQTSNIVSRGATPVISLMPYSTRHVDMLAAISSGAEDVYIDSWIQSFKAWRESYPEGERPSIMLRFGHEFNSNWYPWGNNPEGFKAAWRHIHAKFEAAGVNHAVEWVWCASATDVDDYNDVTLYYPGADVVDWTGLDGYNWGSNYAWTSWRSFDEVFSSAYVNFVTNFPDKPILIAEVGSAEPDDLPDPYWGQYGDDSDAAESKEAWVSDMMQRIKTDYPAIRAISWFNINKELSWALNGTAHSGLPNTGLNAYNEKILDAHFSDKYFSLKDQASTDDSSDTDEDDSSTDQTNNADAKKAKIAQKKAEKAAALAAKKARIAKKKAEKAAAFALKKLKIAEQKADKKSGFAAKKARIAKQKAEKAAAFAAKKAEIAKQKAEKAAAFAEFNDKEISTAELRAVRTEYQRAMALSRTPKVVGKELRKREADGFRKIAKDMLKKIREKRLGTND